MKSRTRYPRFRTCRLLHQQVRVLSGDALISRGDGNGTAFKDPAFIENRTAPVHRWVPWIAGFSGAFVDSVLAAYLKNPQDRALVLDPFAGVGTTLIQAAIRGHDVVGFEINPYAALATKTKLRALRTNLAVFDRAIEAMERDSSGWRRSAGRTFLVPAGFKSRIPFFSGAVERQVLGALEFIGGIRQPDIAGLFRIAFGSTMVSFSNYTYEPSLSSRPGAGKPLIADADVGVVLLAKLRQMRVDIEWLRSEVDGRRFGVGSVYDEDFFEGHRRLEDASVRLMVTSPPYLNNYHYVRNTRPQLYWLSLITSPKDQGPLEHKNFGTYWQVARDKEHVPLTFEHKELDQILSRLRETHREKGQYGGAGWANYAASYFNDCYRFMEATKRVLDGKGVGVVVVGNSIIQGIEIEVERFLADIALEHKLRVEGIYRLRQKRVGNSITGSSVRCGSAKAALDEWAVVVRK